jgi:hypothetical protein
MRQLADTFLHKARDFVLGKPVVVAKRQRATNGKESHEIEEEEEPEQSESIEQIVAAVNAAPYWFIQKVLRRGMHAILYGDSGTAKSGLAYETALRMAECLQWFGLNLVHGYVVLVTGEGREGYDQMERVFRRKYNLTDKSAFKVLVLSEHYEINKERSINRLKRAIEQAIDPDGKKQPHELGVILIIFDTLATCSDGAEDSTPKMSEVRRHMRELHTYYACSTLIIHHTGKDARMGLRGKSIIKKDADLVLFMEKIDRTHVQMTIEKQKNSRFEGYRFEFERVVLPVINDNGSRMVNNLGEPETTYLLRLLRCGFPPTTHEIMLDLLKNNNPPLSNDVWYSLCNAHGINRQNYTLARDQLVHIQKKVTFMREEHGRHQYDVAKTP